MLVALLPRFYRKSRVAIAARPLPLPPRADPGSRL